MYRYLTLTLLVLAYGYHYCSADETDEESDPKTGFMKFHKEISAEVCKPDKTTDAILDQIAECKARLNGNDENKEQRETKKNEIYTECGKDRDNEISAYTKVDVKNDKYRRILLGHCSEEFRKCVRDKIMEARKNAEKKDCKRATKEQRDEFMTCMKKAVGII